MTPLSWYLGNLANFLNMACHVAMTLLPIYWIRIGFLDWQVGWLAAGFSVSAILARLFLGGWLERWGRRPFMVLGPLMLTVVCFLFQRAGDSFWFWMVLRVFQGCGLAFALTAMLTWVTDLSRPEEIGRRQGLFGVSGLVGSATGPLVAERIAQGQGFETMFWTLAGAGMVSACLALTLPESGGGQPVKRGAFFTLLGKPVLRPMLLVTIPFGWFCGTMMTFIGPLSEKAGLSGVGVYFAGFALASIAVRIFAGHSIDSVAPRRLVTGSLVILVLSSLLSANLLRFPMLGVLVCAALLNGLGHGFLFPALALFTVTRVESGERGSSLAVFTGVFEAGVLLGAAASGYMSEFFGTPSAFALASALMALCLPVFRASLQEDPSQ